MRLIDSFKGNSILLFIIVLILSYLLSEQIVSPDKKILKLAAAISFSAFMFTVKQKYLILFVAILLYFPKGVPVLDNTSNLLILFLTLTLAIRSIIEKDTTVSSSSITSNPFFLPSVCIWCSYLVALILSFGNSPGEIKAHTEYFIGLTCALLFALILIGYIRDQKSLQSIQLLMLLILVLNLFFGMLFFFFPGLTIIPRIIEDQSVLASSVNRIGGLTFAWEEYAEYLMMAVVILVGVWSNKAYGKFKFANLTLLLILLLAIIELLLTNTRAAIILAAFGTTAVLFFFTEVRISNKIVICGAFCLVALLSSFLAQESGGFSLADRIQRLSNIESTEFGYMPTDRARVWLPALEHLSEYGIKGYGPSMYPLTIWAKNPGVLRWPHNLILLILITVGLVGLLAYLFMFTRLLLLKKHLATIEDKNIKIFYNLLWLALLLFFIDTMKFDGFLRATSNYFYHCFMLIGILFSAANFSRK